MVDLWTIVQTCAEPGMRLVWVHAFDVLRFPSGLSLLRRREGLSLKQTVSGRAQPKPNLMIHMTGGRTQSDSRWLASNKPLQAEVSQGLTLKEVAEGKGEKSTAAFQGIPVKWSVGGQERNVFLLSRELRLLPRLMGKKQRQMFQHNSDSVWRNVTRNRRSLTKCARKSRLTPGARGWIQPVSEGTT